jgi:aminoglycoside phosphotransferase family enzyme/predicted kinase
LTDAMLDPGFYIHSPDEVLHKETHISHVFLAGQLVYKIKKPVRFPFLDFSTLAKRRHFLEAELRLNRRLSPTVYLEVVPIFRQRGRWRLKEDGKPVEYALVMRRLPEKRMLDYLLQSAQASTAMIERLADRLAAFHAAAEPVKSEVSGDHLAATSREWRKNMAELTPLVAKGAEGDLALIAAAGNHFLENHSALIARRAADGWIRDVHGDLHAEHICFAPEGIQIFDCIEFNDDLRRCDLASEIAFLLMDLSVRGGEPLVKPFLRRYFEKLADEDMPTLLPFYQCYRALVRAKVHALRLGKWNDESARYFEFAKRFRWHRFQPFLLLVSGFTGSGKSTLAHALGARLDMKVINSDEVRKRISGKQGAEIVPLNEGIYSPAMTENTYNAMAAEANEEIAATRGVILDGTFGQRAQREKFIDLARQRMIPLLVIRCLVSDPASAERLQRRAAAGADISDGRWEIYAAQKAAYEPMKEISQASRLDLRTEAPVEDLLAAAEAFLFRQLNSQ